MNDAAVNISVQISLQDNDFISFGYVPKSGIPRLYGSSVFVTWIKKMWHIYTMEYYSAIKRNETELFVVRWMDLESVIQSEVSQKEKNKYSMLTHIYGIEGKKKRS